MHDAITNAIDTILVMPDTAVRLAAFAYLREEFLSTITRERNRAAYEARLEYTADDLSRITGCKTHDLYRWSSTYATENRLPLPRRARAVDISAAVDIASRVGVYRGDLER